MNKKIISRCFVVGAILVIACPITLEYVFHVRPKYILRFLGIRYVQNEYWFFAASSFLMIAFCLQFPFKEEEAWHCECGYDLSFSNQQSKNCPECGMNTELEWSAAPGTFARKTKRRFTWAIFLLLGSLATFGIGALGKLIEKWANC